jgi:hypothetical protein
VLLSDRFTEVQLSAGALLHPALHQGSDPGHGGRITRQRLEEAGVDMDVLLWREAGRVDPPLGDPYRRLRKSGDAPARRST